jgi:hypothetical protein
MEQSRGDVGRGWRLGADGTWSWQSMSPHAGVRVEPDGPRATAPRRPATAPTPAGQRFGRAQDPAPETAAPSPGGWEPTPIFQAITADWERHQRHDVVHRPSVEAGRETGRESDPLAAVPGARAGTGPVPVVRERTAGHSGDLDLVPVVPPPPPHGGWHEDVVHHREIALAGGRDHAGLLPEPRAGSGPLPVQRPREGGGSREADAAGVLQPSTPRSGSIEDELKRRAQRRRRPLDTPPPEGGRHALRPRDGDEPTMREDLSTLGAVADVLTFSGLT